MMKNQLLVEAEKLYERVLENITNNVVSDNILSTSSVVQKESEEQNSDDKRTSSAYSFVKEERTLLDPEDREIERNSFVERPDVLALVMEWYFIHTKDKHGILILMPQSKT